MFSIEKGTITFELSQDIEYADRGKMSKASRIIMFEPVKDCSFECIELKQMMTRALISAGSLIQGKDAPAEELKAEGEVVIPFHKQDKPDPAKIMEQANSAVTIMMMSRESFKDFVNIGKTIFTTRHSGNKRRVCVIDDEAQTPLTAELFKEISAEDQIKMVALYYSFFGLSSTGEFKPMSSGRAE